MKKTIDFHTHAFPDHLATSAISHLEKTGNIKAFRDGSINSLIKSMNKANIERAVICSIATRPEQFNPILAWSMAINSERIIPLPSVHPHSSKLKKELKIIDDLGFIGIKMHPYYQNFSMDDRSLDPLYRTLSDRGLLVVMHSGYDIAFPRKDKASPAQALKVLKRFPDLRLITTHMGGWDDWDNVEKFLIGKKIYMELSFATESLPAERLRQMLDAHPSSYLLFGTDSPWNNQKKSLKQIKQLGLPHKQLKKILRENAMRLIEGR